MIPFEEIDKRLSDIEKTRAWLAEVTPYSADYLRTVLAPKSTRRTPRVQQIISDAIEREEERLKTEAVSPIKSAPALPDRVTIECQPEERRRWNVAAKDSDQHLDEWIVGSLNRAADIKLMLPPRESPGNSTGTAGH